MYKIDDKLYRNSECGRQSALSVPKTVQAKRNQGEIIHTLTRLEECYAIPSQLIVNLVHDIKRLHPSPIIQVNVDVVLHSFCQCGVPAPFRKKAPGISTQGVCEGAGLGWAR